MLFTYLLAKRDKPIFDSNHLRKEKKMSIYSLALARFMGLQATSECC